MLTGIHFFVTSWLGLGEAETQIVADKMIIEDTQNFIAAFICETQYAIPKKSKVIYIPSAI